MPYWKRLIYESWISTWELVVGQPLSRLIILGAIVLMTVVVYSRWKRIEDFWAALRASTAFVISSAVLFAVIFIWHLSFITPKKLVEQADADKKTAEAAAQQLRSQVAAPSSTPIQLDVREHGVDSESRERIDSLQKQLNIANETIRTLESRSDVFGAPISAAQFDIVVRFAEPLSGASVIGSGPVIGVALIEQRAISLGSNESPEPLLIGDASQYQTNDNELHAVATMRFDSKVIGKTVRSLTNATFLQLELPPDIRSEVVGGTVRLVVNGSIPLTFKIPPHTVSQPMGNVSVYRIFEVKETLRALDTPRPSPTPNTAASPP